MYLKKKNLMSDQATQTLAGRIATQIITTQAVLAISLNRWINKYSIQQQKYILGLSGAIFACLLILSFLLSSGYKTGHTPLPVLTSTHIGLPSATHVPLNINQTADSLTIKK